MAAALLSSAVFAALLLSPPAAGTDTVTWHKCKQPSDYRGRVLKASPDSQARAVHLQACHLTEVRSGDFDGLPNVDRQIWLAYNYIEHVDPNAFIPVPKLKLLYLDYNYLREVPVFDEHSYCPSLTTLYLSYNRITEIKHQRTFSGCAELQVLNLENNVIEYIHPDVFRPLRKLNLLNINNNRITVIPETLFIKNNKLNSLFLAYNNISFLPSDFASKLRSAGIHLYVFHFDNNPWHCACLLELLGDVKRAGEVDMSKTYTTGTGPMCVYDGPHPCCRRARSGLLSRAGPGH